MREELIFFTGKVHVALGLDYDGLGIEPTANSSKSALVTGYATLGYKFIPNLNTYLLGGFSSVDGMSGGTYGAGVRYQIVDHVAVDARYKHASLTPGVGPDVNVNVATVDLEINFETVH